MEKIKELKILKNAHDIAQNFDYIPESTEAIKIHKVYGICSTKQAEHICKKYEGYSPDDILSLIKRLLMI